jgi:hypothetical protein
MYTYMVVYYVPFFMITESFNFPLKKKSIFLKTIVIDELILTNAFIFCSFFM